MNNDDYQTTKNFRYTSLDTQKSSFRPLRLLGGDTVEIQCEIFHASIHGPDAVPYEALSYTWGSGDLVDEVRLNNRSLWITENLHTALRFVRHHDRDRILWVDAICIDQSNFFERSQQVQKMGSIFESAREVIYWLGRPTAEVVVLMRALNELQYKSHSPLHKGKKVEDIPWKQLWSEVQSSHKLTTPNLNAQSRTGLKCLFERPWFKRVWTLQEVARSQSAVVCSGSLSVSVYIFALASSLLELSPELQIRSVLDLAPGPERSSSCLRVQTQNLHDLLSKFHACKATDKRDMIFALLGFSSDISDHSLLRADYTKSLPEVLRDVVRYWFEVSCLSVEQVFEVLTGYERIQVTYVILSSSSRHNPGGMIRQQLGLRHDKQSSMNVASESAIREHKLREVLASIGDASLILVEQYCGDTACGQVNLHTHLDDYKANLEANPTEKSTDALDIHSLKGTNHDIRSIVIYAAVPALYLVSFYGCAELLNFVAYKIKANDDSALNRAFYSLIEVFYNLSTNELSSAWVGLSHTDPSGYEEVGLFLDNGADINLHGRFGPALVVASLKGDHAMVELLLSRGADIEACGTFDMMLPFERARTAKRVTANALQVASVRGHKEVIKLLLSREADINALGGCWGTALTAACMHGSNDILQILQDNGADVNRRGGAFGTPLHSVVACSRATLQNTQLLLDHGADINAQMGDDLRTPLDEAVTNGDCEDDERESIVELLLERGADISLIS